MTVYNWQTATSGNWSDAARWSGIGAPPDAATADAVIATSGSYTVTLQVGQGFIVSSLALTESGAALDLDGRLTLTGSRSVSVTAGTLVLTGAIDGAILDRTGGAIQYAGGTLDGATIDGTLDLSAAGSMLTIADGLTLTGASGTGRGAVLIGQDSTLAIDGSATLDNATVTIATTGGALEGGLVGARANATLTLGSHLLVILGTGDSAPGGALADGGQTGDRLVNDGTIQVQPSFDPNDLGRTAGQGVIGGTAFTNAGTIVVGPRNDLTLDAATFSNSGLIAVDSHYGSTLAISNLVSNTGTFDLAGGELDLSGDNTTNWGDGSFVRASFTRIDGTISTTNFDATKAGFDYDSYVGATIINTGTTLDVGGQLMSGNTDAYGFRADVVGGVVLGDGVTYGGGELDGVTYRGLLIIGPLFEHGNGYFRIEDGITLTGADGTGPGAVQINAGGQLDCPGPSTLDHAAITLDGYGYDTFYGAAILSGQSLTIGANLLLQDAAAPVGGGALNGGVIAVSSLVNDGTILAHSAGGTLAIAGGTMTDLGVFTNLGLLEAGHGDVLSIQVPVWTNLAHGTLTGGTYDVEAGSTLQLLGTAMISTLNAVLTLHGAGSIMEDFDGSIYNVFVGPPPDPQPTYRHISFESMLTAIGAGGTLQLLDGRGYSTVDNMTDNGLLVLDGGTFSSGGTLVIGATGTLEGHGEIAVPIASAGTIIAEGGNLILDDALTGGGSVTVDAGATLTLDGNATMGATTVAGTLQATGDTVEIDGVASNSGTIAIGNGVIGGTLTIAGPAFSNSGTVTGAGDLLLSNLKSNTGLISFVDSAPGEGALYLSGDNTTPWGGGSFTAYGVYFSLSGRISTQNFNSLAVTPNQPPGLTGTIVNTGATLDVTGDRLFDPETFTGTIQGGVLDGDYATFAAGTLDGVTYRGGITIIKAGAGAGSLVVTDGITLTGASGTGPGNVYVSSGTALKLVGATTLDNATVYLTGAPPPTSSGSTFYTAYLKGSDLTLGQGLLVRDNVGNGPTPGGEVKADALGNLGTIEADIAGGLFEIAATQFTNQGLLSVSNGDELYVEATNWTNLLGTTLSAGSYFVGAKSELAAPSGVSITTLAATLTLSGVGSEVETFDYHTDQHGHTSTTTPVLLEATLTTIAASGTLQLEHGRAFVATHDVTDNGLLVLDGGTFSCAGSLTIGAGGTLFGHGEIAVPIASAGKIVADGGTLILDDDLTGGSSVTVDAGSTLTLDGNAAMGAMTVAGTLRAATAGDSVEIDGGASGNSGTIAISNGANLGINGSAFRNSGTVSVTGGGGQLFISNLKANTGTISIVGDPMSAGELYLSGDNTTPWGGGSITASNVFFGFDGRISTGNFNSLTLSNLQQAPGLNGTIVNTGATLDVTGAGNFATYAFYGTISGGVVDGDGTTFAAGTLDGVTYRGSLTVGQFHNFVGSLTVTHGITLTGGSGTGPGSATVSPGTQLYLDGPTTLDHATITLQGGGPPPNVGGPTFFTASLYGTDLTLGRGLLLEDAPGSQDGTPGGVVDASNLVNLGTIEADSAGGLFVITGNRFINLGLMTVANGDELYVDVTQWANLLGTTLSSGNYLVGAGSELAAPSSVSITRLAATLTLSGAGSELETFNYYMDQYGNPAMTPPVLLESTLTTIAAPGMLRLEAGRGFAASHAITDNGTLFISGGTFSAVGLTIGATGILIGTALIAAPIANAGTIESSGGLLTLAGGVSGAGTLRVDAGSKMVLPADTTAASITVAGTLNLLGATASAVTTTVMSSGRLLGLGTVARTVANAGTIESHGGLLTLIGGVTGGGAIVIDAGSKLNARATATAGTLTDAGTLQLDGHTVAVGAALITATGRAEGFGSFLGPIADAGTVEASGGRLSLGAITGAGALLIAPGATLELTQATSHDVDFAGAAGTLALDAPAGFSGVIGGLLLGDSLTFKNELISSAAIQPGPSLQVIGSSGTFGIGLADLLPHTMFAISADRHSITLVHV